MAKKNGTLWLVIFLSLFLMLIAGLRGYFWYKSEKESFQEKQGRLKMKVKKLQKEVEQLQAENQRLQKSAPAATPSAAPKQEATPSGK